jgi:hypothetical protein
VKTFLAILDGEWVLRFLPNGGTAVIVRTVQLSTLAFLLAIGVDSYLDPKAHFAFDWTQFLATVKAHLTWFGVLFGGIYVALYSRFSSQWSYLAGLYNSLMQLECQEPRSEVKDEAKLERRAMAWAAFIDDAWTMHLAAKPSFSSAIRTLLSDERVRTVVEGWYADHKPEYEAFQRRIGFIRPTIMTTEDQQELAAPRHPQTSNQR